MKTTPTFAALFLAVGLNSQYSVRAQGIPSLGNAPTVDLPAKAQIYSVAQRGNHHRIWQSTTSNTNALGKVFVVTNSYTELETGMHMRTANGQWVECDPEIRIQPDGGATADNVQHPLYLPGSLYNDAIECRISDKKVLTSRPLGMVYFDGENSLLIAELRDGPIGQLLPSGTQVLYTNICTQVHLDLVAISKKSGYESDLVIREQLPDPATLGFSDTSEVRVQWWTEFFSPVSPAIFQYALSEGVADQILDFGETKIGPGVAYLAGNQGSALTVPVTKQWIAVSGRTFLVEEIPYPKAAELLAALPVRTASVTPLPSRINGGSWTLSTRASLRYPPLPAQRLAKRIHTRVILARGDAIPQPSFVVDYDLTGTLTNWVFQSDTTYYVSNSVLLSGSNVFEGGTVIKYASNAVINVYPSTGTPTITFLTSPYRPIICTAKDDNSIGTTITGSSGSPSGYYANPAFTFAAISPPLLSNIRIVYAKLGIGLTGLLVDFSNLHFVNCATSLQLQGCTSHLRNALFVNCLTNFALITSVSVSAENATFSGCACLALGPSSASGCALSITNCILANVTNVAAGVLDTNGNYNAFYNTTLFGTTATSLSSYPFQSVGAGNCYLVANGAGQNVGTTNINTNLLASLKQKTTYPPVLLSNVTIVSDATLSPQAQRDTDAPDLGFHYDPIDWITYVYTVTNATLTITNGTVVAYYDATGIWLQDGAQINCVGLPTALNRFVDFRTVQEQPLHIGSYTAGTGLPISPYRYTSVGSPATFRFTAFNRPAAPSGAYDLYASAGAWRFSNLKISDCQFSGCSCFLQGANNETFTIQNNCFEREGFNLNFADTGTFTASLYNNLFINHGQFYLDNEGSNPWTIRDNVFDSYSVTDESFTQHTADHNAYTSVGRLLGDGTNDVSLTNFTYVAGPLGNYYQLSTNLINAGSRTADLAGLYHYTTQTNEVKEINSTVEIGFHYVAVDANGRPIDTDGDGTPDYLEDSNGNGAVNSGETDWNSASDLGLKVLITRPKSNSTIP